MPAAAIQTPLPLLAGLANCLSDGTITLNAGLPVTTLDVVNTGDRPVQVGSHYHFAEANPALSFDRTAAYGQRLDIPAGTSVRFEPGIGKPAARHDAWIQKAEPRGADRERNLRRTEPTKAGCGWCGYLATPNFPASRWPPAVRKRRSSRRADGRFPRSCASFIIRRSPLLVGWLPDWPSLA